MERKNFWVWFIFSFIMMGGFRMEAFAEEAHPKGSALSSDEVKYLSRIEAATFRGFEKLIDPATQLPVDIASVSIGDVVRQPKNEYFSKTSPTNIGLGFLYLVLAKERGYLSHEKAYQRALRMMDALERLETHEGFLYNWYYLSGEEGKVPRISQDRFVSSLDNGDLDIMLMATAGAFQDTELAKRIDEFLRKKDYRFFYDKNPSGASSGMMSVGYDQAEGRYHAADYSIFNIEGRMTVLIAMLKDNLPDSAWTHMFRLVKTYVTSHGERISVVAPWGGSLYETLFAEEIVGSVKVAPKAFWTNAVNMIRIHRDYGHKVSETGIWGFSNGEVPGENKYEMAGVPAIAYNRFSGQFVTVYSSFLSMRYAPKDVVENLRKMETFNPEVFNSQYGFTDSMDPKTGRINFNILSLDKGMELLSIANFMAVLEGKEGIPAHLWNYFKGKGWDEKAKSLLEAEESNPSFQAIMGEAGLPVSASAKEKSSSIDAMEVRQEIGTFYEPGRANASFQWVDSDEKGEQMIEVRYDVTKRYSFSGLYLKFDDLDVSDYEALSLGIKGDADAGFPKTIKVELKSRGRYVAFDHVKMSNSWQTADIMLPPGNKMIDEIAFVIENAASGNHPKGKVDVRSLIFKDGILK